jgi:uncharacterized protein (TIGR03083 family)
MNVIELLQPIHTAHLFPVLECKLIKLLRSLKPDEWERQTIVPQWNVRDVVAHLLDTQLRKLSMVRDGFVAERPEIHSSADLTAFVNRLNHEGVMLYRRLSSRVLISLMETASGQSSDFHQSLDPNAEAAFAVSWAGESVSANWFDTAREFTERWHHQQQIRLAVSQPEIMTRELYFPVLDTFMRALPFHYRERNCTTGSLVVVAVAGECGGSWNLCREETGWKLSANPTGSKIAEVMIPQEIAWRVFTKGIDRQSAAAQIECNGDRETAFHILSMLAIVG